MGEDFDNHRRIFDSGDDLQGTAAVRALFDVDVEDEPTMVSLETGTFTHLRKSHLLPGFVLQSPHD
jgi:hypothetical protein